MTIDAIELLDRMAKCCPVACRVSIGRVSPTRHCPSVLLVWWLDLADGRPFEIIRTVSLAMLSSGKGSAAIDVELEIAKKQVDFFLRDEGEAKES